MVRECVLLVPFANTVNRLGACRRRALDIVVSKRTGIPVVSSGHRDTVGAALLVLVRFLVVLARGVSSEGTHAVHRLSTAIGRALLERLGVWAAITVVSSIGRDLVHPAAPVLVVLAVMEACIVGPKRTNTVDGLGAASGALVLVVILKRTKLATMGRGHAEAVNPVLHVPVLDAVVVAARERTIGTHTIDRLAALILGAVHLAVEVRTSLTVQVSGSGHHVRTAALILMAVSDVLAVAIRIPGPLAVHGLTAATLGALLEVMHVRASIPVVLGRLRHLVQAAPLVLMVSLVIETRIVSRPRAHAVHRLVTTALVPLLVVVCECTFVTIVGSRNSDPVVAEALVLVESRDVRESKGLGKILLLTQGPIKQSIKSKRVEISGGCLRQERIRELLESHVLAHAELIPLTHAVHRLGATISGALLESLRVRAAIAVVGRVGGDLVQPAAPVLVVLAVVVAGSIRAPSPNAVHGLAALVRRAFHLAISVRASLAAQVSLGGHLVGVAALVLVAISNMSAGTIRSPLALAIHGLAAAGLRALLEVVCVRASIAIVQRDLRHLVETAALIFVVVLVVVALIIGIPRAHAVHRLSTTISGALLKVVGIGACMSTKLSNNRDVVKPASPVLVVLVMSTRAVRSPCTNTVHRLGTSNLGAVNMTTLNRAINATVLHGHAHLVGSALDVLVLLVIVSTRAKGVIRANTINRLGTGILRALDISVRESAREAVVR